VTETAMGEQYIEWKRGETTLRGMAHVSGNGTGIWLVINHGFTSHSLGPGYLYVSMSRYLADHGISSLRYSFAGAGESDGLFMDMTVSSMSKDAESAVAFLRDRYSPAKLALFGHSLGGCVAAGVAAKTATDALVLVAPVAFPMNHVDRYEAVIAAGPNQSGKYELGPFEMTSSFLDDLRNHAPLDRLNDGFCGPVFVFRGAEDNTISENESRAYVEWAESKGLPTEYAEIEHADHRISTVRGRKFLYTRVESRLKEIFG